jgi:hypothetical protein
MHSFTHNQGIVKRFRGEHTDNQEDTITSESRKEGEGIETSRQSNRDKEKLSKT